MSCVVYVEPVFEALGWAEPKPAFEDLRCGDLLARPEGGSLDAYGRRCADLVDQPSVSLSP
jgi:hypothetical protein